MADARWIEIERDAASAMDHFQKAAALHDENRYDAPDLDGYRQRMALMHAMQSGHTSLESALLRILKVLGEEPPEGENWHRDLLRRAALPLPDRPAILSMETSRLADETRRFRHVAARTYDDFRPDVAAAAIEAARALAARIGPEVALFRAAIDPAGSPPPRPPSKAS